jgi:Fusaric acid resistance protein family
VARIEEISLGVVCAAVAHSVFFPQNMLEELTGRIDRTLQSGARTCRCDRQQLLRRKIDGLFLALGDGWDEATPLAKTASEAAALRPTKD